MKNILRIATRKSPLALWQANFIKERILSYYPSIQVEIHGVLTIADKMLATPLNKIGGKGLFVKELEEALLGNKADIAVHSMKDMPANLPPGLTLAIICKRDDPRDAFVSNNFESIWELPKQAILGTSSLRRKAQALRMRPDITVKPLRGNVGTRLRKLDDGEFDAIILASVGLKRLALEHKIKSYFSTDQMLPACGQGALGIECREDDTDILDLLSFLKDADTFLEVTAERVLPSQLGASCQLPIASFAVCSQEVLTLNALVSDPEGTEIIKAEVSGPKFSAKDIGLACANKLISQGALQLLERC